MLMFTWKGYVRTLIAYMHAIRYRNMHGIEHYFPVANTVQFSIQYICVLDLNFDNMRCQCIFNKIVQWVMVGCDTACF